MKGRRVLLMLTSLLIAQSAQSAPTIRFHARCEARGAEVTLGEIANIECEGSQNRQQMAEIPVGPAPEPGQSATWVSETLIKLVQSSHPMLGACDFAGARSVVVHRPAIVPAAVLPVKTPKPTKLAKTTTKAKPTVRSTRTLDIGVLLRADDLECVGEGDAQALLDALIGKQIQRRVGAGQALGRADVREPVIVNKGAALTVQVREGAIALSFSAVANDDGSLGDWIEVTDPSSKRVFPRQVRLTGASTAELPAGAPPSRRGSFAGDRNPSTKTPPTTRPTLSPKGKGAG